METVGQCGVLGDINSLLSLFILGLVIVGGLFVRRLGPRIYLLVSTIAALANVALGYFLYLWATWRLEQALQYADPSVWDSIRLEGETIANDCLQGASIFLISCFGIMATVLVIDRLTRQKNG